MHVTSVTSLCERYCARVKAVNHITVGHKRNQLHERGRGQWPKCHRARILIKRLT